MLSKIFYGLIVLMLFSMTTNAETNYRTDSFSNTHGINGSNMRTDSFGNTIICRQDSFGTTRCN